MWRNHLKVAFRNLIKQKAYSLINILGFALGLAVCMIITFYILDDLTYDNFHEDPDNVFHMVTIDHSDGSFSYDVRSSITAGPLMATLEENIPEVLASTRITSFGRIPLGIPGEEESEDDENRLQALTIVADSSFFNVFSFRILEGEKKRPLQDLNGLYISKRIAETLFPGENPVGQTITAGMLENAFVAGIIDNVPNNSHLQFDVVVPLRIELNPVWWNSWENLALVGYFRIAPGSDPEEVKRKIIDHARQSGMAEVFTPDMQPLLDVHLGSNDLFYDYMNQGKNDRMKVYTMGIIAILVLLVASINFINLSSARANRRAKEVGMRKVIGGNRKQLFLQFLSESILITVLAMILALTMFEITIPHLNEFLHKNLSFNLVENFRITLGLVLISLLVGVLAGLYPALVISSFKPLDVLQGQAVTGRRGALLRKILVVGQFAVSIALICSVFIVLDQIEYLNRADMGYNRDRILVLPNFNPDLSNSLRDKLAQVKDIESVAQVNSMPGATLVRLEVIPEGHQFESGHMFDRLFGDYQFVRTLEMKMLQGRDFSADLVTDQEEAVIINESAQNLLGWANPIGKKITMIDENEARLTRTIIGVVKDFNFLTTRRKVNPIVLLCNDQLSRWLLVKYRPGTYEQVVEEVEGIYEEIDPDRPRNFLNLDEVYNFQFREDRNFALNIAVFSILAIVIASLGLLGLASFTIQQRLREIALRKVLGSSARSIALLLTKDFARWVLFANLIGWPLAYFGMKKWLANFIYQTNINPLLFLGSGLIALTIAILTIVFQTLRAARINPSNILKYE